MNYLVLFKNAIANVLRGSAAALVAILLPPFLIRIMPNTTYGTWVLILQLSAYVGYLDFGIQTTVGRFVAHANELGDSNQRDRIVSTSLAILTGSAGLGVVLIALLAWQLPNLFHEMPALLYNDARWALLFVGCSLSIGLPFSVFNGIFIGLQRNEVPAIIIGSSKLIGAILIIVVASINSGLAFLGATLAIVNIGSYVLQLVVSRRVAKVQIRKNLISKQAGYEIFNYCFSLTIWSFAMLFVSGLDTAIVGFFDFEALGYYGVVANLVIFITGLQIALFSVLMPAAAVLGARGDADGLGELLINSTRYSMFILLLTGLPLIIFAQPILTIWVGTDYAIHATILLKILIVANIIRLSATPYMTLLIGTGQQRIIIISPLAEGFSNLVVSVIAGALFGVIGVAVGTLFGGVIGVFCNFLYNMPRSTGISIQRRDYLVNGLLRPLICVTPFAMVSLIINLQTLIVQWTMVGAIISSILLIWKYGLLDVERKHIIYYMAYIIRFLSTLRRKQST